MLDKPQTIIGVTGTNGKTTVCNMINDILSKNGYKSVNNAYGSNTNAGVITTLLNNANLLGKSKLQMAVLEIDERSANKIYPFLTPTYLVCNNIFRDSLMRNAHTEFIASILNQYIAKETIMIENADDLICSHIADENKKIYFGIDRLDTDTVEPQNITRDIRICPKCFSPLKYEYYRYHHIGKAHCPNCDFGSREPNYLVTNLDIVNKKMVVKHDNLVETYDLISDNIINIYNMLAVIIVLQQIGMTPQQINQSFSQLKIVETRFSSEQYGNYQITTYMAKGMNPIACSRAFDYVKNDSGNKAVVLILDDLHEENNGSENTAWHYDSDYEFLNDESIKQIIIAGPRYLDGYLRLLMANIDANKIIHKKELISAVDDLQLSGIEKIYVLHDLYSIEETKQIKTRIKELIDESKKELNNG